MILHVLIFKNLAINAFTTPQFVDINPDDAAIQLQRSIVLNKDDPVKIKPYEHLDLYHVADFDDQTGKIVCLDAPKFLLSCRDVIVQLNTVTQVSKKEEVVDAN